MSEKCNGHGKYQFKCKNKIEPDSYRLCPRCCQIYEEFTLRQVNIEKAAKIAKLSPSRLRTLARAEEIIGHKRRNRWMIEITSIHEWLERPKAICKQCKGKGTVSVTRYWTVEPNYSVCNDSGWGDHSETKTITCPTCEGNAVQYAAEVKAKLKRKREQKELRELRIIVEELGISNA